MNINLNNPNPLNRLERRGSSARSHHSPKNKLTQLLGADRLAKDGSLKASIEEKIRKITGWIDTMQRAAFQAPDDMSDEDYRMDIASHAQKVAKKAQEIIKLIPGDRAENQRVEQARELPEPAVDPRSGVALLMDYQKLQKEKKNLVNKFEAFEPIFKQFKVKTDETVLKYEILKRENQEIKAQNKFLKNALKSVHEQLKDFYESTGLKRLHFDVNLLDVKFSYERNLSNFLSGDNKTYLAFKDSESYICVQKNIGLVIIEQGKEYYFSQPDKCKKNFKKFQKSTINSSSNEPLTLPIGFYWDVVYASNYYFISEDSSGIMRKSVDDRDPELWYHIEKESNDGYAGRQIRVALHGRALVINKNYNNVLALEIKESGELGKEVPILTNFEVRIKDHGILGLREDKVAILSLDGRILIYRFSVDDQESVKILEHELSNMLTSRGEFTTTLSICPRSRFLCVSSRDNESWKFSRIVILELIRNQSLSGLEGVRNPWELVEKTSIDLFEEQLNYIHAAHFDRYFGNFLVLGALTLTEPISTLITFYYDVHENEIKEIRRLRKNVLAKSPVKMVHVNGRLYSSDENAKILQIKYST